MCGAVHCSDIAILGYHRKPPMVDHAYLDKMCEVPWPLLHVHRVAETEKEVDLDSNTVNSIEVNRNRCIFLRQLLHHVPVCPWRTKKGRYCSDGRR
ncbi:MAG: hypothetical protein R2860_11580 [Desulfobacterales bacterium]